MPTTVDFATPQVNQTSFAREMVIANAVILDAVAKVGSERSTRFKSAKIAAGRAFNFADTEEELEIADTFIRMIVRMEKRGMHR